MERIRGEERVEFRVCVSGGVLREGGASQISAFAQEIKSPNGFWCLSDPVRVTERKDRVTPQEAAGKKEEARFLVRFRPSLNCKCFAPHHAGLAKSNTHTHTHAHTQPPPSPAVSAESDGERSEWWLRLHSRPLQSYCRLPGCRSGSRPPVSLSWTDIGPDSAVFSHTWLRPGPLFQLCITKSCLR